MLNENDSFNFFFNFFLAGYDHAALEANTNSASLLSEGVESFSYDKSQAFLGMLFSKNMCICKMWGMCAALYLMVNHAVEWMCAFFILKLLTFLPATSNHPLKTLPTFKTIELTNNSNAAMVDGMSQLHQLFT